MGYLAAAAAIIPVVDIFLGRHSTVILRYSWDQAAQREDRNTKIPIAGVSRS